eukprot:EG_transcript_30494
MGKDTILQDVENWFFADDSFAEKMEAFAQANCDVFDVDSTEQKLEYTVVYTKFREMFEKELEAFVTSQGVSIEEFSQLAEEESKAGAQTSFRWIVATSDYEVFLQMMMDEKRKRLG